MRLSATTTRVPVQNGHTGSISVGLKQKPTAEAVIDAWRTFRGLPQDRELPSAPPQPVVYQTEHNRGLPIVALGHNTIRGAAGAAILNAELMHREGLL